MIDNCGNYTYIRNTPENEKCDMDICCELIEKVYPDYQFKYITIEELSEIILFHVSEEAAGNDDDMYDDEWKLKTDLVEQYLRETDISQFDYMCYTYRGNNY